MKQLKKGDLVKLNYLDGDFCIMKVISTRKRNTEDTYRKDYIRGLLIYTTWDKNYTTPIEFEFGGYQNYNIITKQEIMLEML